MGGLGSGRKKGINKKSKSELGYAEKIWASQKKNSSSAINKPLSKQKTWGKTKLTANEIKKVESHVRKYWEKRNGR